jgi:hypothetical protein
MVASMRATLIAAFGTHDHPRGFDWEALGTALVTVAQTLAAITKSVCHFSLLQQSGTHRGGSGEISDDAHGCLSFRMANILAA